MEGMMVTVLGSRGFIGREVVRQLADRNIAHWCPERGDEQVFERPLGRVIYCCGLTADFRSRPHETIEAHVGLLNRLLAEATLDKLVYLSSTRVYLRSPDGHENAAITLDPNEPGDLYNASKIVGEFTCQSASVPTVVARLSNVYGPDWESNNFLIDLIRDAVTTGALEIRSAQESAKDYVSREDIARWLIELARDDSSGRFNLASGQTVSNEQIADALRAKLGCHVRFGENAPVWTFPTISNERITKLHGPPRRNLIADLPQLVQDYLHYATDQNTTVKNATL